MYRTSQNMSMWMEIYTCFLCKLINFGKKYVEYNVFYVLKNSMMHVVFCKNFCEKYVILSEIKYETKMRVSYV